MIEKPHKLIPLLPLASALCLLIVFVFYSLILGMPDFEMLDKVQVSEQVEAEFRARALWGVTAACLDIALIWNIVISIIISRHNFESFRNARKYAVYIAIASLPPYLLITFNWAFGGAASHFMQRQIAAHANSWVVPLTTINNFISGVVITLLVFTCCSLLYWPESMKKNRANGNNVIRMVAKRIEFGRLSLYSAGALLVIGILRCIISSVGPAALSRSPKRLPCDRLPTVSPSPPVSSLASCSSTFICRSPLSTGIGFPSWLIRREDKEKILIRPSGFSVMASK